MKMHVLTAVTALALPFMALGQTTDQDQTTTQGQTKETQTTAPAKGKKARATQELKKTQTRPESSTNVRGQTNARGHTQDVNTNETGTSSSHTNVTGTTGTSQTTTVNKDEFRMRHSQVFSLGRHPKEFFVQRYGANHVRLIGNTYFVYLDGCWASIDVDGFVYTQRVICPGDPDFVEVVD